MDVTSSRTVVALADVEPDDIALVGGKAAGLAEMIKAGERVPEGFCITTAATARPVSSGDAAPADRRRLRATRGGRGRRPIQRHGRGPAARQLRGPARDDPERQRCRRADRRRCGGAGTRSASERAIAYREAAGIGDDSVRMGVVVQRMVDPVAAGVLFTANPITGTPHRRWSSTPSPVSGTWSSTAASPPTTTSSTGSSRPTAGGCLTAAQLEELRAAGDRLQRRAGSPQDVEWAFDRDGTLWLLQSRAITTLFPLPASSRPGPRVYLEVGHMQGMLRPFTPMGMSAMRVATAQWLRVRRHRGRPVRRSPRDRRRRRAHVPRHHGVRPEQVDCGRSCLRR